MKNELIEAWRTNNRINLMLIEHIKPEGMPCTLSKRGGRGVAGELARGCHWLLVSQCGGRWHGGKDSRNHGCQEPSARR